MKHNAQVNKLSVSASDTTSEATILIYGAIGYDWENDWDEQNLAASFVKKFAGLDGKYDVIHLRLHSVGGSMYEGQAMITAIRNAKSKVIGYNDGLCASMAADLWLACPVREMATNALLMIHQGWTVAIGNANELRAEANVLEKWNETAINVMHESTGISRDDIRTKWYDGQDHWFTYDEVIAEGMMRSSIAGKMPDEETKAAAAPAKRWSSEFKVPANYKKLSHLDLSKSIKMQPLEITVLTDSDNSDFLTINDIDMNIDAVRKALKEGALVLEDLKGLVDEAQPEPKLTESETVPVPEPTPEPVVVAPVAPAPDEETELFKEVKALKDTVKALQTQLQKYSNAPGASQTHGQMPGDDPANPVTPTTDSVLDDYRKAIQSGEVKFG
jgi:ATP-dependent protease ClpP protease subunit